jgi:transcriptional regulator
MKKQHPFTKHERRIEILTLRNQGWSFSNLANKYGINPTSVMRMYNRIKNKTVEQLEEDMRRSELLDK